MKALVLVQSTNLGTYVNVCAAICVNYPTVTHVRLLYVTDDQSSVTKKLLRERLVELSKQHSIYEVAADLHKDAEACTLAGLRAYMKDWDIVDVTGVSKETSLSVAAISIGYHNVRVCLINWRQQFKKDEVWILTESNHEYVNLLSSGDLALLRKDHFQKKHVIFAFAGIFGLLTLVVVLKMLFPAFFVPNVVVNIFGLLIGVAGLYLAAVSLKSG